MPRRALGVLLLPALLAATDANAQRKPVALLPLGNPGALVEAESALTHRARDRGAANAMVALSEDGAEVIAGSAEPVRAWVKAHDVAPWFVMRRTDAAYAACDGTAGVTTGYWRDGWYTLVWRRQKALDYRVVLAVVGPAAMRPAAPDWITGKVADCPPRGEVGPGPRPLPAPLPALAGGADRIDARSDDGSLIWARARGTDGTPIVAVWLWRDGAWQRVGGQG